MTIIKIQTAGCNTNKQSNAATHIGGAISKVTHIRVIGIVILDMQQQHQGLNRADCTCSPLECDPRGHRRAHKPS